MCAVIQPWEALIIGVIGGALAIGAGHLIDKIRVDDPVCASAIHGCCGLWVSTYYVLLELLAAACAVVKPWESVVIGIFGGAIAVTSVHLVDKLRVDDPVSASSVHGVCGVWVRWQ